MPDDVSPPHGAINLLAWVLIAAISLFIAWEAFRSRYVFVIQFTPDQVRVKRGVMNQPFLEQLQDLQKHTGLSRGSIRGHQHGKLTRLSFSRDFPDDCKQRVRNLWAIYK